MEVTLKRIGLILMMMQVSAIVGMENHNWWQNGPDADPTPPNTMDVLYEFVAIRVDLLPADVGVQVWNTISQELMDNKAFSINDAEAILERFEDEQDRLDAQEEDLKFCFFHPSSPQEDEVEIAESN